MIHVNQPVPRSPRFVQHLAPVPPNVRELDLIANEIRNNWPIMQNSEKRRHHPAWPYLLAMYELRSIEDIYGLEDADDIVLRFLNAATGWRGETARRIKAELNAILKARAR